MADVRTIFFTLTNRNEVCYLIEKFGTYEDELQKRFWQLIDVDVKRCIVPDSSESSEQMFKSKEMDCVLECYFFGEELGEREMKRER